MALQVLDENQIVRTIPEVSEVGARIDEKVQANMPEDGADGKDGLSIWETTTNTTTGTTSIAISTLNKVAGRSVQVGDYIIGNATYSYLYLVTAVNSTTVTVTYRRTLRGATGSGGSVTVDTALSETSENPVQNKVINAALKDGTVTKIGNVLKVGGETYNGSAAVNAGRRSWYGVCPTTGNQPAKEVNDIPDFVLETGAKVSVRFTYENIASSPTLNINSTGAKSIRNSRTDVGTLTYRWYPGQVVDFIYDGTYWLLQQPVVATTTYYGASKVASLTLNGSPNATPSFYAPTSAGNSGQFLRSNGSGAPTWVDTPYITKHDHSGSTWARKWSDGFIECGGLATGNTVNISFLNEYNFATTNYCVALCYQNSDSSAGIDIINISAYNKATTGFTIRNASSSTFSRTWMAFGY